MWFVTAVYPDHPGKAVAWGMVADPGGGTRFPGELAANTLDELRAMLPDGLKRSERTPMLPPEVVETWERHANAAIDNASRTANVTSREPPFSV
jgi:hypothetical protein